MLPHLAAAVISGGFRFALRPRKVHVLSKLRDQDVAGARRVSLASVADRAELRDTFVDEVRDVFLRAQICHRGDALHLALSWGGVVLPEPSAVLRANRAIG